MDLQQAKNKLIYDVHFPNQRTESLLWAYKNLAGAALIEYLQFARQCSYAFSRDEFDLLRRIEGKAARGQQGIGQVEPQAVYYGQKTVSFMPQVEPSSVTLARMEIAEKVRQGQSEVSLQNIEPIPVLFVPEDRNNDVVFNPNDPSLMTQYTQDMLDSLQDSQIEEQLAPVSLDPFVPTSPIEPLAQVPMSSDWDINVGKDEDYSSVSSYVSTGKSSSSKDDDDDSFVIPAEDYGKGADSDAEVDPFENFKDTGKDSGDEGDFFGGSNKSNDLTKSVFDTINTGLKIFGQDRDTDVMVDVVDDGQQYPGQQQTYPTYPTYPSPTPTAATTTDSSYLMPLLIGAVVVAMLNK